MAVTLVVDTEVQLTTNTVTSQVLLDSQQAYSVDEYDISKRTLAAAASHTFTGGTDMTVIATNISTGSAISIQFGGNTYTTLGSLLVLPGRVGEIVITNTLSTAVDLEIAVIDD